MVRGGLVLLLLTTMSTCVLSLPLTPSQQENEDVKVMKCIVEALAEVLSRPRPSPVSRECLVTLRTDDRLVSVLRHYNFLKELQEIAVQGDQERSQRPGDADTPEHATQTPPTADDVADRSMLEALGGPGERSILSQKRGPGDGDGEEGRKGADIAGEEQVKRGNDKHESSDNWTESKAEKREEEEEEEEGEYEEKRADLKENSEEEHINEDKKGAGSAEKRDAAIQHKPKERLHGEDEKETEKRHGGEEEEEDEGEMKRGSRESRKRWSLRAKAPPMGKEAAGRGQQEVPHHSKEVTEEEEEEEEVKKRRNAHRSPEEKELQMIAQRAPEEKRGSEEEGSASRRSEDPEIESLAAIESELENVAQKLHELRRG